MSAQYRQLGSCGLKVSVPILGAMSFGTKLWGDWVLTEEEALPILKEAWDRGINTIDTANVYSYGVSERIIGKFITKYAIPRSQIVILTKFHELLEDPEDPESSNPRRYVNKSGSSRAAIFDSVEGSLERLGTSYIDLLQLHRFDPDVPVEETMKALHDLIIQGKVRYIGASSMWTWQFSMMNFVAEKNGWTPFVSMQNKHSLLYREEEREMIPYCNSKGIGLIPYSPLSGGSLSRPLSATSLRADVAKGMPWEKELSQADKVIISRVEEIAKKYNKSMAQISLSWVNSKVSSPIVGTSTVERVRDNIFVGDFALSQEETAYLEEPYLPKPVSYWS